jgi:hypothetical protein
MKTYDEAKKELADFHRTGGPAFPTANGGSPDDGMTLRDYFAAKALPALIQARAALKDDESEESFSDISAHGWGSDLWENMTYAQSLASDAYFIANAMLEERAK